MERERVMLRSYPVRSTTAKHGRGLGRQVPSISHRWPIRHWTWPRAPRRERIRMAPDVGNTIPTGFQHQGNASGVGDFGRTSRCGRQDSWVSRLAGRRGWASRDGHYLRRRSSWSGETRSRCHDAALRDYYGNGDVPGDWLSPVPIPFLAVAAGTTFQFAIAPRTTDGKDHLQSVAEWLKNALQWLAQEPRLQSDMVVLRLVNSSRRPLPHAGLSQASAIQKWRYCLRYAGRRPKTQVRQIANMVRCRRRIRWRGHRGNSA